MGAAVRVAEGALRDAIGGVEPRTNDALKAVLEEVEQEFAEEDVKTPEEVWQVANRTLDRLQVLIEHARQKVADATPDAFWKKEKCTAYPNGAHFLVG